MSRRDEYNPVAEEIPFDNSGIDFESESTQEAVEEAVFSVKNVIRVNKQHYPGHFSSIKDALDNITDSSSSSSNPYCVLVGPGVYVEDNSTGPIKLKPGVTLKVEGHSTVIVEPQNVNNDLFLVDEENCRIQGMTLRGVTGASALKITASPTPAIVDFITISNCLIPVYVQSDSAATQAVFRNLRLISGPTTTDLMKVESLDEDICVVKIYSGIFTDDSGTSFESGIKVLGTGSKVEPNTVLLRSTTGIGTGILLDDGGHLHLTSGCEIEGFLDNLVLSDSGTAPSADIQSMVTRLGVDSDIRVIHADSFGTFDGIARRNKIFNAAPTTFLLVYMDPINANFNNSGMIITRGFSPESDSITTDGNIHQLTRFSAHVTDFTGSTANTRLRMPDATTFSKTGHQYSVWNFSSVEVEIQDFGGNELAVVRPNGHTIIVLRNINTANGVWGLTYTLDSGNVFGSEGQVATEDAETSTTSNSIWSVKTTLTTLASLPIGDYLISWQFVWRTGANREMDVRVRLNNTTTIEEWTPSASRAQDNSLISGFAKVDNISGINDFTLEFKVGGPSTTVFMRAARLFLWRIG